ncbi:unnamed protein product [Pieris macdunnoughi]|uniref:Uncharacterized protein n=1 Tax=Pieris macdunnoughi TaxID=345717 RepID=A0A821NYT3_9NEOP|nr:unnamed protein product [Pieris macdunnoughi]
MGETWLYYNDPNTKKPYAHTLEESSPTSKKFKSHGIQTHELRIILQSVPHDKCGRRCGGNQNLYGKLKDQADRKDKDRIIRESSCPALDAIQWNEMVLEISRPEEESSWRKYTTTQQLHK